MKMLSFWARRCVWPARLLITCCFLLLNALGYFVGSALAGLGTQLPLYLVYLLMVPVAWCWMSYPGAVANFSSRKLREAIVAGATFIQVVCLANAYDPTSVSVQNTGWMVSATAVTTAPAAEARRTERPQLHKKQLRQQLKTGIRKLHKRYSDATPAERVGLILLAVLVAMGLVYLLVMLSCSIACAGSEGLALVVGILGTAGIVFLLIRVIRAVNKKHGRAAPNLRPQQG